MKKCEAGHYYSDHLNSCPYCESSDSISNNFVSDGAQNNNFGETTSGFNDDETAIPTIPAQNEGIDFESNSNQNSSFEMSNDFEKTVIIDNAPDNDDPEKNHRPTRKLVGWLVSYTIDEMGHDYQIYEGKNLIGNAVDCEVTVISDKSVSVKHATILYRNNKFLIRDEFSTNGTFVNGKIVEENTPSLQDGDIIKVGDTIFMFKIALFDHKKK